MKKNKRKNIKNKLLAFMLALCLAAPVFAGGGTAAGAQARALGFAAIFVDYVAETIWVVTQAPVLASAGWPEADIILDRPDIFVGRIRDSYRSANIEALARTGGSFAGGVRVSDPPQFMYALRAAPNDQIEAFVEAGRPDRKLSAVTRERWFPIYGGGVDISRAIPTNTRRPVYIAIRRADDIFNSVQGFESRVAFRIAPRYNNRVAGSFAYDAENESIVLSPIAPFADGIDIVYRFDLFSPNNKRMNRTSGISVPADMFALGATVSISTAPQSMAHMAHLNLPDNFFARSRNIRFRVPRQPAAPSARVDANAGRVTGMRRGLEFTFDDPAGPGGFLSAGEYDGGTTLALNQATPAERRRALTGAFSSDIRAWIFDADYGEWTLDANHADRVYKIWVRVAPVPDRGPASPATLIKIPASMIN